MLNEYAQAWDFQDTDASHYNVVMWSNATDASSRSGAGVPSNLRRIHKARACICITSQLKPTTADFVVAGPHAEHVTGSELAHLSSADVHASRHWPLSALEMLKRHSLA